MAAHEAKILAEAGIVLENVVHYEGATHYFVATPSRECLQRAGVLPAATDGSLDGIDSEKLREGVLRHLRTEISQSRRAYWPQPGERPESLA